MIRILLTYFNSTFIIAFLNSFIRVIFSPLIVFAITIFLFESEQGYWYTFISIASLNTIADLGFNQIITRFSAHEFKSTSKLKSLIESNEYISPKLLSLFKFSLNWNVKVIFFSYPVIFTIGFYVLIQQESSVLWILPWIIYSFSSSLHFFLNYIFSFFEGIGYLKTIQNYKLFTYLVYMLITLLLLIFGFGLYSLALSVLLSNILSLLLFLKKHKSEIIFLLKNKHKNVYNWFKDLTPLMVRYLLSWLSGFLIFQVYTPLTYIFYGIENSGKVGATISIATASYSLVMVLSSISIPKMNVLVAQKKWEELDYLFKNVSILSLIMFLSGFMLLLFLLPLRSNFSIFNRFSDSISIIILYIAWFLQVPINLIASYGRSFKKEPFVFISIIMSAISILITIFVVLFVKDVNYIFSGFIISSFIGLILFSSEFIKKHKVWQKNFVS